MNIVFGWRRLTPPAFIGGAELTEASLAGICRAGGHDVTFIGSYENPRRSSESSRSWLESTLRQSGVTWNVDGETLRYEYRGLNCIATTQSQLGSVLAQHLIGADILWTSQEGCTDLAEINRPDRVFSFVHSVSQVGLASARLPGASLIAPSRYVMGVLWQEFGLQSTLVRTPLRVEDLRADAEDDPRAVLFVNPVPDKGLDLVVDLATRMDHVEFVFVEAWRPMDLHNPPRNVRLVPRSMDVTPEYRKAAVLLVPSLVQDASPRVIAEAAAYGVASIGAPVGGIPELIASADLLVSTNNTLRWEHEVRRLLADREWRSFAGGQQLRFSMAEYSEPPGSILTRLGL